MQTQLTLRRNIRCGLYACMALTLFLVEAQIPLPIPLPGIKLGLANTVTLFVIRMERTKDAFAVLLVRIVLSALFCGQPMTLLYALCGGMCSFVEMALLHRIFSQNLWFVSALGSVFHIVGQLLMAGILLQSVYVIHYAPILILCAVPAGMLNGWIVSYMVSHVTALRGKK